MSIYALLLWLALGTILLASPACDVRSPLQTAVVASSTPPGYASHINISREDYNQALARWRALHVSEYEMTVDELSLSDTNDYPWVLHVKGDHITVLVSPLWDRRSTPVPFAGDELAKPHAVAGLFARVDEWLTSVARETVDPASLPWVYTVEFDWPAGYPKLVMDACREPGPTGPPVCPSDTYDRETVTTLTVLQQDAPGTSPVASPSP